jgi:hypothetical protein
VTAKRRQPGPRPGLHGGDRRQLAHPARRPGPPARGDRDPVRAALAGEEPGPAGVVGVDRQRQGEVAGEQEGGGGHEGDGETVLLVAVLLRIGDDANYEFIYFQF